MHWSFYVSLTSLLISVAGLIYSTVCCLMDKPNKEKKDEDRS